MSHSFMHQVRPRIGNRRVTWDASNEEGETRYFGMKVDVGADMSSRAVYTVEITAAYEAHINVLSSYCGRKTKLSWAMRTTSVMNTNADHGSWEYAGVCKTNASPNRIFRGVRKSVTGSILQSGQGWNHLFGVIKQQFGLTRTATADKWIAGNSCSKKLTVIPKNLKAANCSVLPQTTGAL